MNTEMIEKKSMIDFCDGRTKLSQSRHDGFVLASLQVQHRAARWYNILVPKIPMWVKFGGAFSKEFLSTFYSR
jgi:hypothetical protein